MVGAIATPVLLALLGALWIAAAAAATVVGLRRAAAARQTMDDVRALAGLVAASPCVPLLIHAKGTIEAEQRIADWLGLDAAPRTLDDLAGAAVNGDDLVRLRDAVTRTFGSGARLAETLRVGNRVFAVEGGPHAAPGSSERTLLVWLSDVTRREHEIARLGDERERLGQSLDSLSTLIEAAPFPMWYRGGDLRLSLVNGAYVRAVEATDATDVVRRGLELIEAGPDSGPGASAREARDAARAVSRTAPAIVEGQRRMMRVVDVPLGRGGVAGFALDIQELEDARADLLRFGQAQRDMLDRLSAGVAQFGGDHGLTFYNNHFLRLFRLDPDWLADRPTLDLVLDRMREAERAPESRDFPGWRAERRQWFLAAEPVEENWLLPGGNHIRVVAQPLPDSGLLLIFEDRTEHLQLASARDTLLRVRTATFDNLFEAIGVFAADGRLHLWNNRFREVWGLGENELGRHPRVDALAQAIAPKLIDPSKAGAIRELVRVATLDRQQREGRIAMRDGRHYEFAAVPLPDGNALFTLLDVTASRGIEEALRDRNDALEQANSLKNAFVSTMSYELRVPLTTIAGYGEMLAAGYAGELAPGARDYVDAILSAVARLGTLIGDGLDLTQSEAGSLPMATNPVELAPLIREAAEIAAESARTKGLVMALDVAADSGVVQGDRRRLRQSLDHLLRNAVAYTPSGGRVMVRSRIAGDRVEIAIVDNGPGIPPARRERLFDRLSRVRSEADEARSIDDAPATGLGLPLARQFVAAHGGELVLTSEVGRGTSAVVRLPVVRAAAHG